MTVRRHSVTLLVAAVVLIVSSFLLYRVLPVAGITLGVSSGVIAAVVMVHLGVFAALIAPFIALRRRSRGRKT
jgi:hypothetical protein